jgi:hypothetical protein
MPGRNTVKKWMRSSPVVRASDCHCQCRNSPGFDPSILWQAADEAVLNTVFREREKKTVLKLKQMDPGKSDLYCMYIAVG